MIPSDHPVQPIPRNSDCPDKLTCGTCGLSWDDGKSTSMTPVPAGRCPFEAFHEPEPESDRPYELLPEFARQAVNRAFDAVKDELLVADLVVSFDDRAERLVDAIATYVVESGNS